MKKHFYSHLIEIDSLFIELGSVDLSQDERSELHSLISSNIHHSILDAVLSELSEEDKKVFLSHLSRDDHPAIWDHLESRIENATDKIRKVVHSLTEEIKNDISKVKKDKHTQ